jgi:polysaccharide export outer membrane protein
MNNNLQFNLKTTLYLCTLFFLVGCSTLPGAGPKGIDSTIELAEGEPIANNFAILNINSNVVSNMGVPDKHSLTHLLANKNITSFTPLVKVGAKLFITIWEASEEGLFSSAGMKNAPIEAIVEENGKIFFPFVGPVYVKDNTLTEVRIKLELALAGKAVEPQIQVAFGPDNGNKLTVVGDVNAPGHFSIPSSGLRLLDAIAFAGGGVSPSYESEVKIVRGDWIDTIRFGDLLSIPNNNILLSDKDTIQVIHRPKTFSAFGAVQEQSKQTFTSERITLIEALAQVGGLNDNLADAGGVFLFRFEDEDRFSHIDNFKPKKIFDKGVATVFLLDLSQAKSFFLANSFYMQDKDIIFVANSSASEFKKFVQTVLSPLIIIQDSTAVF